MCFNSIHIQSSQRMYRSTILPVLFVCLVIVGACGFVEVEVTHLYCQPAAEGEPLTPMLIRIQRKAVSPEVLSGRRIRILSSHWPSIVDRVYWLDTNWDDQWFFLYEDDKMNGSRKIPSRPDEKDIESFSRQGLSTGGGVPARVAFL